MNEHPFLIVALTGSIGTGKTSVANELQKLGAHVIDADILAREVISPGTPALEKIKHKFGLGVINNHGELDRKRMGQIVFNDKSKKDILEQIIHPKVRALFFKKLHHVPTDTKIVIYSVPLLFESKNKISEIDKIVVVSAPEKDCINRIVDRDSCTPKEAKLRYDSQMDTKIKEGKADYVIVNDDSLDELKSRTAKLYKTLFELANNKKNTALDN